jgi:hypothetical protein
MHAASRAVALLLALAACGGTPSAPTPPAPPPPLPSGPVALTIAIAGGNQQSAAAATAVVSDPTVAVRDTMGKPVAGVIVRFVVTAGQGWITADADTTGVDGMATTTWYLGPVPGSPQALSASLGGRAISFTAIATPLVSGTTYVGRNSYIEFTAGDGPFILSAPHGGALTPAEIPDRTVGTFVTDLNTDPMARAMASALLAESGRRPHLVISRLRRTKLDPNRAVVEAANGNPAAVRAWREYHGFIEAAKVAAAAAHPRAFYVDLHGHGHAIPRLEWGYLLGASTLNRSDNELNAGGFALQSSIRQLAATSATPFAELLRGPTSLGARFEAAGYPSVPSPTNPSPGAAPYFDGGYSTARHGSSGGGAVSGVQLEMHYPGVRDTGPNRLAFANAAARVLVEWLGVFP